MQKRLLIIGVIFYTIIFFLYYPAIFAFRDESEYLWMAYVLRKGTLFIENTGISFGHIIKTTGHMVPYYPIGQSLLLVPLTFFGWKSVFLLGIFFHLLGLLFFIKLLKIFKLENPFLPYLYLFFPAFVFFSRTIMSDIPSTALFIMACYYYFKPKGSKLVSGMFFGILSLLRQANVTLLLSFLIISVIKSMRKKAYKATAHLFYGAAPFILLLGALNYLYYGSPFLTGYSSQLTGLRNFSFSYFLPNLNYYSLSLILIYPLMLFLPLFAKETRRSEFLASTIVFILLYSLYYYRDRFPNRLLTHTFGIRFLFPIIPLFLLSYAELLNKILRRLKPALRNLTIFFISAFLMIGCLIINYQHQQYLKKQLALKEAVYKSTEDGSVIIYDYNAAELMQIVWGDRIYIRYGMYKNILEYLKKIDVDKNIYLIKREFIYTHKDKEKWIPEDEMALISQHYELKEIVKKDGLEVFKCLPISKLAR